MTLHSDTLAEEGALTACQRERRGLRSEEGQKLKTSIAAPSLSELHPVFSSCYHGKRANNNVRGKGY